MDLCLGAEGISRWIRKGPSHWTYSRQAESCSQITIIQVRRYYSKCLKRRRDKRVGISDRKGDGAWSQSREAHKSRYSEWALPQGGSAHVQVKHNHFQQWCWVASSYAGHWYLEHILYENDILSGLGFSLSSKHLIHSVCEEYGQHILSTT